MAMHLLLLGLFFQSLIATIPFTENEINETLTLNLIKNLVNEANSTVLSVEHLGPHLLYYEMDLECEGTKNGKVSIKLDIIQDVADSFYSSETVYPKDHILKGWIGPCENTPLNVTSKTKFHLRITLISTYSTKANLTLRLKLEPAAKFPDSVVVNTFQSYLYYQVPGQLWSTIQDYNLVAKIECNSPLNLKFFAVDFVTGGDCPFRNPKKSNHYHFDLAKEEGYSTTLSVPGERVKQDRRLWWITFAQSIPTQSNEVKDCALRIETQVAPHLITPGDNPSPHWWENKSKYAIVLAVLAIVAIPTIVAALIQFRSERREREHYEPVA